MNDQHEHSLSSENEKIDLETFRKLAPNEVAESQSALRYFMTTVHFSIKSCGNSFLVLAHIENQDVAGSARQALEIINPSAMNFSSTGFLCYYDSRWVGFHPLPRASGAFMISLRFDHMQFRLGRGHHRAEPEPFETGMA